MKTAALYGSILLFVVAFATSAHAQVLYAAASGADSPLYIVDPATGSVTSIGNIGFGVTALARHPVTGVIYGTTAQGPVGIFDRFLLRIDPSTGAGTVIGPIGLGTGGVADIAFRSDGTLFGWSESTDDLITIDLNTGAGTIVGSSGIGTLGSGLAFNSAGTLYLAGDNADGELRTVDTATGLTTVVATLTGAPDPANLPIPAMKFQPGTDVLYALNRTNFSPPATTRLITINPGTGAITVIGPTTDRLDALVWVPSLVPGPSLTEVTPAGGSTLGGTAVTLHGSDFSAERLSQVTFDGVAAGNVVFVNSSTITLLTPAHPAGVVDVTVHHTDGTTSTLPASFTYVEPPPPPAPTVVTLAIQLRGFGAGRVVSGPAGIACGTDCTETYTSAVAVQLTAIPAADAAFAGWTGDADCADGAVTMTASRTCGAQFERLPDGLPLDLNGDGRGDIVGYSPASGLSAESPITSVVTHNGVLRAGDVNGDRRSDIIGYEPETGVWTIELGGATLLTGTTAPRQSPLVLDVNGDGFADVVFHDPVAGRVQPCIAVAGGLDCRTTAAVALGSAVLPLDLNGDGRGDLLAYRWTTGQIEFLLGGAGGTFDSTSATLVLSDQQVLVLDANGDRRSDLLVADPIAGTTTLLINTAAGFMPMDAGVIAGFRLHAANLDGDARADLIAYDAATGQTVQALNTASGFTVTSSALPIGRQTAVTDLDGDGRSDLVLYDASTGAATLAFSEANGTFTQQHATAPPGLTVLAQVGAQ